MNITIQMPDLPEFERNMRLAPKEHALAALYANNRGATSVRAKTARAVARETGVRVRDVRKQTRTGRATGRRPHSRVWVGTAKQVGGRGAFIKNQPVPNPPRFLLRLKGRPPAYYYRDPVKTMRGSKKAALRQVRGDLTPYVSRHLPKESYAYWRKSYADVYNKDFLRRYDRLRGSSKGA